MSDIISFAKTNFRNQEVQFGIKRDDRRRHFYVIGKTGMGKTNMLENMAIQDIRNGHGVCFIDPHGDTAERLISMIPEDRVDDVIYFNPADQEFPIAFNVMEKVEPEFRPLIASGLVGVFKKLWSDSWGPRLEYILRNTILALLEYQGSTLLGVMRILVDKNYRKRVTDKINDPIVKSFWIDEFPKWSEKQIQEVISPIQNKVGQFLTSPIVRNIIGQSKSTFNVREVMDGRKILILNLSKGKIGEDNSSLIGAMIITKIQLATMERVEIPENERKDFYLYVDEFQNFATESFANILSEARKYRLNLILANQYITQLEEKVRDAIFGNAGTIVSFRVGATDAEFLEKEFEPVFTMNDIVNLPKYGIYLKLMIDGIAGDAFSATTLPPIERIGLDSTEEVIKNSREKYAISKKEAEERIARLMGILPESDLKMVAQKFLKADNSNESLNDKDDNSVLLKSSIFSNNSLSSSVGGNSVLPVNSNSNDSQFTNTKKDEITKTSSSVQNQTKDLKNGFKDLKSETDSSDFSKKINEDNFFDLDDDELFKDLLNDDFNSPLRSGFSNKEDDDLRKSIEEEEMKKKAEEDEKKRKAKEELLAEEQRRIMELRRKIMNEDFLEPKNNEVFDNLKNNSNSLNSSPVNSSENLPTSSVLEKNKVTDVLNKNFQSFHTSQVSQTFQDFQKTKNSVNVEIDTNLQNSQIKENGSVESFKKEILSENLSVEKNPQEEILNEEIEKKSKLVESELLENKADTSVILSDNNLESKNLNLENEKTDNFSVSNSSVEIQPITPSLEKNEVDISNSSQNSLSLSKDNLSEKVDESKNSEEIKEENKPIFSSSESLKSTNDELINSSFSKNLINDEKKNEVLLESPSVSLTKQKTEVQNNSFEDSMSNSSTAISNNSNQTNSNSNSDALSSSQDLNQNSVSSNNDKTFSASTDSTSNLNLLNQKKAKQFFKTNCSTCDDEIEVPFQPDGVRPVFCRECIKDYQRAVAKAKEEEKKKFFQDNPELAVSQNSKSSNSKSKKKQKREFKEQVFISKDKPLSLSQIPYVAPKKFSGKKEIDFAGLREMIQKVKSE